MNVASDIATEYFRGFPDPSFIEAVPTLPKSPNFNSIYPTKILLFSYKTTQVHYTPNLFLKKFFASETRIQIKNLIKHQLK